MFRVDARPGMSKVYACLATKIGGPFEINTMHPYINPLFTS